MLQATNVHSLLSGEICFVLLHGPLTMLQLFKNCDLNCFEVQVQFLVAVAADCSSMHFLMVYNWTMYLYVFAIEPCMSSLMQLFHVVDLFAYIC